MTMTMSDARARSMAACCRSLVGLHTVSMKRTSEGLIPSRKAGTDAAIGFVVAAKTLARFRQLDDREFAEYYLLGTLASVAVAIVTALAGRAALSALLA